MFINKIIIFLLILSPAFFVSCAKNDDTNNDPDSNTDYNVTKTDQSYGSDVAQKFDIYLPANRTTSSTPILFLIHGGAWKSGDKNDFTSSILSYKSIFPNYAIVTMNYRLYSAGANKFPTQEMDVKSCIEYVVIHRADYQISSKFALVGYNSGAHLAMLYAYKHGATSYAPKAVVDMSGATDLISCYDQLTSTVVKSLISDVAGDRTTVDSLMYKSSSPLNFTNTSSAPTLIIHGINDTITPYQQAYKLQTKLQQLSVVHTYTLYSGEGQTFSTGASTDALQKIQTFINAHIN